MLSFLAENARENVEEIARKSTRNCNGGTQTCRAVETKFFLEPAVRSLFGQAAVAAPSREVFQEFRRNFGQIRRFHPNMFASVPSKALYCPWLRLTKE